MTPKEVQHLFELARIEASSAELEKFPKELGSILDYVKKLSLANVKGAHKAINFENNLRLDEVRPDDDSDRLIKQFPEVEDRQLKTKKVFGEQI